MKRIAIKALGIMTSNVALAEEDVYECLRSQVRNIEAIVESIDRKFASVEQKVDALDKKSIKS